MENIGAKYPAAYVDSDGNFLRGSQAYVLHLPPDIPAAIFWSVTVYDPITGSGLDNGQPFPSLNTMDKPIQNSDGSTDIYFRPSLRALERTGSPPFQTKAGSRSSGSTVQLRPSSIKPGSLTTLRR